MSNETRESLRLRESIEAMRLVKVRQSIEAMRLATEEIDKKLGDAPQWPGCRD
jgi:hypothetical protein